MRLAIILASMLLWGTTAQAQYLSRAAPSGKPIKLGFASTTNPDCTAVGETTVRVVQGPRHGRVDILKTRDFPTFSQTNIRSVCNTRRVPGTLARYVSHRGFVGYDYLTLEVISANGVARRSSFAINVR